MQRLESHDDDTPTFERIRRHLGPGHDYAENRGALKSRHGSASARRRHRGRARRLASKRVPAALARLLGL